MHEIELKFIVPADRRAALEKALRRGKVETTSLRALYFDTAGDALARQGIGLRLRKEGRRWVQTVKAPGPDAISRLEHNAPVAAGRDGATPILDFARHDGTAAGQALRKAWSTVPDTEQASLALRFETDVKRITRTLRSPGARAELALDMGQLHAGDRSLPIREFEAELESGSVAALVALAGRWSAQHGLWLSTVSKAERGARLARGQAIAPPMKAAPPAFDANQGGAGFLLASVRTALAQVLGNASEVAADEEAANAEDDELVHQLRIGLRRLRTALRELAPLGSGIDPAWEPMLRRAFQELGADRDLRIVVPAIRAQFDALGGPGYAAPRPPQRVRQPAMVVRAADFQRTLLEILAFTHAPQPETVGKGEGHPVGDDPRPFVSRRLDELHQRIVKDGKKFAALDTARQHRVRKRLKRLRYLSEFAAPLFGRKKVGRFLEGWRKAQDALGEHNDQRVAAELFREEAQSEPRAWFAVGWLAAQEKASVRRCARALRKAADAAAFWRA